MNQNQNLIGLFDEFLRTQYGVKLNELTATLKTQQDSVPVTIFNKKLGCLETIVKYLKENKGLRISQIAKLLGKNPKSISSTYNKANKKFKGKIKETGARYWIPLKSLKTTNAGVLETISFYLQKHYGLRYKDIAILLHRDERTIWTAVNKARGKLGKK